MIIPFALVEKEMIITKSALRASFVINFTLLIRDTRCDKSLRHIAATSPLVCTDAATSPLVCTDAATSRRDKTLGRCKQSILEESKCKLVQI